MKVSGGRDMSHNEEKTMKLYLGVFNKPIEQDNLLDTLSNLMDGNDFHCLGELYYDYNHYPNDLSKQTYPGLFYYKWCEVKSEFKNIPFKSLILFNQTIKIEVHKMFHHFDSKYLVSNISKEALSNSDTKDIVISEVDVIHEEKFYIPLNKEKYRMDFAGETGVFDHIQNLVQLLTSDDSQKLSIQFYKLPDDGSIIGWNFLIKEQVAT